MFAGMENSLAPDQFPSVRALIEDAIDRLGSEDKLAKACGVTQPAIWKAKTTGKISPELALAVHRATDGAVSAACLRPDLWAEHGHVPPAPSVRENMEAVAS